LASQYVRRLDYEEALCAEEKREGHYYSGLSISSGKGYDRRFLIDREMGSDGVQRSKLSGAIARVRSSKRTQR
jgi:hypothetical protein